ncbi:hypothetical protein AYI70_g342 [Smittium culicis]|uniref:Gamma-soluble NSF attachment protein n=1 Tax=Smittium culicis TaxID=133412 RepID=A0A1R1YH20_9FUNG|nr:hypothetical protein AYI70_g342 [Smittium culicis]
MSLGNLPLAEDFVKSAKKALYFSAKAHESAAKVAEKKLNDKKTAGTHYQLGSDLFLATASMPDRAAELMTLAGKYA